jgi:PAS domain S-box-containing protein
MKNHLENTENSDFAGMLDLLTPALFNEISDIVSIKTPDHTILYYNQAGFKMLGMDPKDVIGRKCYELIGRKSICEDCPGSSAVKTNKSERAESYFELIDKWFEVYAMPVCNRKGEVIYILEILRDITHLKKLQEELLRHESGIT